MVVWKELKDHTIDNAFPPTHKHTKAAYAGLPELSELHSNNARRKREGEPRTSKRYATRIRKLTSRPNAPIKAHQRMQSGRAHAFTCRAAPPTEKPQSDNETLQGFHGSVRGSGPVHHTVSKIRHHDVRDCSAVHLASNGTTTASSVFSITA